MNDLIIYGAGGLGRELVEIIEEINAVRQQWRILGFVDDGADTGKDVCGYPVLGGLDFFRRHAGRIGVAPGFADCAAKEKIFNKLREFSPDLYFPVIVHPSSYISTRATFEEGAVVARYCSINVNAKIGKCVLISNKSEVSHEVSIGDFSSVMPSVNISGNVTVGKSVFLGVQAAVLQGTTVGGGSVVGMGSMVLADVPAGCTVVGNPAEIISRRVEGENK